MRTLIFFLLSFSILTSIGFPTRAQSVVSLDLEPAQSIDGLYLDNEGTLYAAGTFTGFNLFRIASTGATSLVASGFSGPIQSTRTPDGNLFVTNFNAARVTRISPEGNANTFATVKDGPSGIVSDKEGNLYVSHYGVGNGTGNSITKITPDGTVSDFASGGTISVPVGLAIDNSGNVYAANLYDGQVTKITPEGQQSPFSQTPGGGASLGIGHLVWAKGQLFATHIARNQVYVLNEGTATVYAGSGEAGRADGPASMATFTSPNGLAASVTGDTLYVAEAFGITSKLRMIIAPSTATNSETPSQLADAIQLMPNYPNPFSSQTTIRFSLEKAEQVQLSIYDVLGRRIQTLASRHFPAGTHSVNWIPTGATPGTYIYRLETGSTTVHRVMMVQ